MTVYGWAYAAISRQLNPPGVDRHVRFRDAVIEFDDHCKVTEGGHISPSSTTPVGTRYVVWITAGGPDGDEYLIHYQAQNNVFGGLSRSDTLDGARRKYDQIRGVVEAPRQLDLFRSAT